MVLDKKSKDHSVSSEDLVSGGWPIDTDAETDAEENADVDVEGNSIDHSVSSDKVA